MQQSTYRHLKTGNIYRIIDHCQIQVDDVWVDAYIYIDALAPPNVYNRKFARSVVEFHQKFAFEPTTTDIEDSISFLDNLRQTQLWTIFGKYKLF